MEKTTKTTTTNKKEIAKSAKQNFIKTLAMPIPCYYNVYQLVKLIFKGDI